MWNTKRSIILSYVVCVVILLFIIMTCILAPFFLSDFFGFLNIKENSVKYNTFMWCLYPCSFFGTITVLTLMAMLRRIYKGNPFCDANVRSLRLISICCFVVALIMLVGSFFCRTFIFIAAAAGFFGLILRVVKNVIHTAVELRKENDLTI